MTTVVKTVNADLLVGTIMSANVALLYNSAVGPAERLRVLWGQLKGWECCGQAGSAEGPVDRLGVAYYELL